MTNGGSSVAVAQVNFFSQSLIKEVGFNVLLPDRQGEPGPYPALYLLHGLSDDYTAWLRWTSLERYVRELPLIVVMPDGGRSFYCDTADGAAYEQAIVKDLLGFVDRHFNTIADRSGRCLGGLSMGGYGAMKLGLKYPDLFCSLVGHSGAYAVFHTRRFADLDPAWQRLLGSDRARRDNDPFELATRLRGKPTPAIRFDCGTDDFLLDHNRRFSAHLKRLGIPHEYQEYPGGHSWDYWDEHIQEAIRFHLRAMNR
jgi:S-formylglutathione hydrolase FrmB